MAWSKTHQCRNIDRELQHNTKNGSRVCMGRAYAEKKINLHRFIIGSLNRLQLEKLISILCTISNVNLIKSQTKPTDLSTVIAIGANTCVTYWIDSCGRQMIKRSSVSLRFIDAWIQIFLKWKVHYATYFKEKAIMRCVIFVPVSF